MAFKVGMTVNIIIIEYGFASGSNSFCRLYTFLCGWVGVKHQAYYFDHMEIYIDGLIYLYISKSIKRAEGLKAFKPAANGPLLNVQIITLLFTIYYTEVHLSFCNYINQNF